MQTSSPAFHKIGLIGKHTVSRNKAFVQALIEELKKHKKEVFLDENISKMLGKKDGLEKAELMKKMDMVIVCGGDGTLLKVARCVGSRDVPVLGVNTGNVGFMTEVPPNKTFPLLEKIFRGKFHMDERCLLRVTIYRGGVKKFTSLALNEAVINQGGFARLINLLVEVNKRKLALYRTDGLIISTPTGSTGHSLSAGGPIVHPKIAGLVLTPICPVKIGFRPIVIPNNRQITVKLQTEWRAEKKPIVLTIDGQEVVNLKLGDTIKIRKSSRSFLLLRAPGRKYYRMLRQKLDWGA